MDDKTQSDDDKRSRDIDDAITEDRARGGTRPKPRGVGPISQLQKLREEVIECERTGDLPRLIRVLRSWGYSKSELDAIRADWLLRHGPSRGRR